MSLKRFFAYLIDQVTRHVPVRSCCRITKRSESRCLTILMWIRSMMCSFRSSAVWSWSKKSVLVAHRKKYAKSFTIMLWLQCLMRNQEKSRWAGAGRQRWSLGPEAVLIWSRPDQGRLAEQSIVSYIYIYIILLTFFVSFHYHHRLLEFSLCHVSCKGHQNLLQ